MWWVLVGPDFANPCAFDGTLSGHGRVIQRHDLRVQTREKTDLDWSSLESGMHREFKEIRELDFLLGLPDLPVDSDGGLKRAARAAESKERASVADHQPPHHWNRRPAMSQKLIVKLPPRLPAAP